MKARLKRVVARLVEASATERIIISLFSLLVALVIGSILVFFSGAFAECDVGPTVGSTTFCYNPGQVYYEMFLGTLGHPLEPGWHPHNTALANTLQQMTLLIFTGLSVAVAFRAGLFNIGTQGQLVVGGLATALAVIWLGPVVPGGLIGTFVLVPAGLLVGAVAGGLYGAIPGVLKAYAGANEVITTIMLNFVAAGITAALLSWRLQDPDSTNPQTEAIPEAAEIPTLPYIGFPDTMNFSLLALFFAIASMIVIAWVLRNTAFGYELRASGVQPDAAAYGGVNDKRMTVASMTISGGLGGIGGALWVMMVHGRWLESVPDLGFDGIAVSVLAGNSPIGVGASGFLFGTLSSASFTVQTATDVPDELIGVLTGLIILFVAMPEFFRMIGRRYLDLETDSAIHADGGSDTGGDDNA